MLQRRFHTSCRRYHQAKHGIHFKFPHSTPFTFLENILQARLAFLYLRINGAVEERRGRRRLRELNNKTFNFQAGNHFVWEFWRGKTLNVPSSYGLLHHYRKCEFGGQFYDIITVLSHWRETSASGAQGGKTLILRIYNLK